VQACSAFLCKFTDDAPSLAWRAQNPTNPPRNINNDTPHHTPQKQRCVTEQYPAKLGATVPELRDVLPPNTPAHAKTLFSMLTPDVEAFLAQHSAVKQVVLVGIETHVCVLQTTLDLIEKGYEVWVDSLCVTR
jgi:nicotinamidase-related amidase